jgi:hypothetical protein
MDKVGFKGVLELGHASFDIEQPAYIAIGQRRPERKAIDRNAHVPILAS